MIDLTQIHRKYVFIVLAVLRGSVVPSLYIPRRRNHEQRVDESLLGQRLMLNGYLMDSDQEFGDLQKSAQRNSPKHGCE